MQYALSSTGLLVYVPGVIGSDGSGRSLMWLDSRDGTETPVDLPERPYDWVRVSPNGSQVAMGVGDGDIWTLDLSRGTVSRLTTHEAIDATPIWTPDGQGIVFASNRDGSWGFYSRAADGTGQVEHLVSIDDTQFPLAPYAWSLDSQSLVFEYGRTESADIGLLTLGEPSIWEPLLSTESEEGAPAISPDGEWIAYHSDETGRREVYVRRFPGLGARQQVSAGRGMDPVWTSDGRGLLFRSGLAGPPAEVSIVPVAPGPSLTIGTADVFFERQYYRTPATTRRFDLAPDNRLLMIAGSMDGVEDQDANQVVFVQNWFEELTERVPVP